MMEYTNEYVQNLFKTSKNQIEVLKKLGYKNNGSGCRLIKKLANQIGLDLKEYGANKIKWNKEKYEKNPRYCKCCGKELTYEQRMNSYCSHSCAAAKNNRTRSRKPISERTCANCGKKLTISQRHNIFCCQQCSYEYKNNERIKKWVNGENFVKGGHEMPSFIKRYLMELHDNKCEKCGWGEENPITHKIPLAVHHIDGDCTNNKIENLQLLCPNCHSLTDNFGSLNKNSKRFHRKKNSKDNV